MNPQIGKWVTLAALVYLANAKPSTFLRYWLIGGTAIYVAFGSEPKAFG